MKKYCLNIPADLSLSSSVRTIAVRIFKTVGFSDPDISRLKLVFDELFMNSVRYGSIEGSAVFITFEISAEKITIVLEDEGGAQKVSAEELQSIISYQEKNTDLSKTSGRGLAQITQQWADDLKVWNGKRGGLCISFSKYLPGKGDSEQTNTIQEKTAAPPIKDYSHLPQKVIALAGEIDNGNLEEKVEPVETFLTVAKESPYLLILDTKKLTFCNSSFIAKIATWKQRMSQNKGDLVIQNIQENILEILELVGMTKLVSVSTSRFS